MFNSYKCIFFYSMSTEVNKHKKIQYLMVALFISATQFSSVQFGSVRRGSVHQCESVLLMSLNSSSCEM